jgi:hypothetical protein
LDAVHYLLNAGRLLRDVSRDFCERNILMRGIRLLALSSGADLLKARVFVLENLYIRLNILMHGLGRLVKVTEVNATPAVVPFAFNRQLVNLQ